MPLVFTAFQSEEAQRRFSGIDALKPGEQLVVISDEGAVYRGANAWIMCLWALENYSRTRATFTATLKVGVHYNLYKAT